MIPRSDDWKHSLTTSERDLIALHRQLKLPPPSPQALAAAAQFPLRVPPAWLARIEPGNPEDPLLRQLLPLGEELDQVAGFSHDPVGDGASAQQPNLLQKYQGRVLLMATPVCALHCRYCFRRHYPYQETAPNRANLSSAVARIASDPSLHEVILSGGDPLSLDDQRLGELLDDLEQIPHLRRLRLHTRLPVAIPERITPALTQRLLASPLQMVVVLHINHPAELTPALCAALGSWRGEELTLLNQAVLLRDVNDSVDTLEWLSEALFSAGILPYYLHLLDRVQGSAHFEVAEPEALRLMEQLRRSLPGYLMPRLVREEAGAPYKQPRS